MMKTMKKFNKIALLGLILFVSVQCQAQQLPRLDFEVLEYVSANPDSIFKAKVNVFIGDSISVHSVRVSVIDSSVAIYDQTFIITALSTTVAENAWKEESIIHVSVPNINPFVRRNYIIELLSESNQLLMQIEKEF